MTRLEDRQILVRDIEQAWPLATAYGGKGLTMLVTQPVCHNAFDGDLRVRQIPCQVFSHQHFATDSGRH